MYSRPHHRSPVYVESRRRGCTTVSEEDGARPVRRFDSLLRSPQLTLRCRGAARLDALQGVSGLRGSLRSLP